MSEQEAPFHDSQLQDGHDIIETKRNVAKKRAVALEYKPKNNWDAPKISAIGKGIVAEHMIEVATNHAVPIVKHADMAEMLSALEVESEIPAEAFLVVAEILRYIYHSKGEKMPTPKMPTDD